MPRSAEAATRFTSTTPHVTTPHIRSPQRTSAQRPTPMPGPVGETPQQRVARLKAAAAKAKSAQVSQFDKWVLVGRRWADRAHRFTAFTLIGVTGVAAVVTVYALGDMIVYNRRKKAEYFAEQKAMQRSALHEAQSVPSPALLTEQQRIMIDDEEKYQSQLQAKRAEKGYFTRGKEWLLSGLKREDDITNGEEDAVRRITNDRGDRRAVGDVIRDEENQIKENIQHAGQAVQEQKENLTTSAKKAFEKERALEKGGGPLDRIGAESTPSNSGGGWTSFITKK